MTLEDLGFDEYLSQYIKENKLQDFEIGRVSQEHKERYIVKTADGEYEAEVTGNLRYSAESRSDFPAVGDWVAISICDSDFAVIHKVLPRKSVLERQAVAKFGEVQIIAANIDYVFIANSVFKDFNINRIERYLTICNAAKIEPIILLTKTDLIEGKELEEIIASIKSRVKNIPVTAISSETKSGYDNLISILQKGKTYCFIGSSGVGKSTLINNLTGKDNLKTGEISTSTNKGRHVTSHRELIILENGSILIDTPGMREIGIADSSNGLETTFDEIMKMAEKCRFSDCTHTNEKGCAVLEAVESGTLDKDTYKNYMKMEREKIHFQSSVFEKRKRDKVFGKMVKEYKKLKKDNRLK